MNLDTEDERQEDDDPVKRRTFVGLSGAAALNAIFADAKPDTPLLRAEPFVPVLAAQPGSTFGEALGQARTSAHAR
jgi:acyl-CoA reductase-like NAD-dependent aldehyde dehydrogenase